MPDITMCKGSDCPLASTCYRHTAKSNPYRQAYFYAPPWDEETKNCDYYLPNEKIDVKSDDK